MAGEKTEKATPKRRKDERKKGNVLQSKDVATALTIIVMFWGLKMWIPNIYEYSSTLILKYIQEMGTTKTLIGVNMNKYMVDAILFFSMIAMPLLILSAGISIIGAGLQTGFMMSGELLKPKFSRMNPITGLGKLFSIRSLVELFKSMMKISVIAYVIYSTFTKHLMEFPLMLDMGTMSSLVLIMSAIFDMVVNISMLFILVATLDYTYQWWEYEKNMRMSKQDIKEEYKQMEGDPQVKGKQKQRQREASQKRMMQAVPTADVVIRNPTHFAIAIKYDIDKDRAPKVVAKGQDLIALKIIQIAEENQISIIEDRPLARALYENIDIDTEISQEFYKPLVEILAFVYKLKEKEKKKL